MVDMNDMEEVSSFTDIHKTLTDATEILAAFISVGRSDEVPPESLLQAAEQAMPNLANWRRSFRELLDMAERGDLH
jgi:hypothetical protein